MNVYNFIGSLGRDCEIRHMPKGDAVTSFSVAVNSGYGDKSITSWINCNLWGKQAESLAPYLKKGTKVAISGEFTLSPYVTKDGVKKTSPDVRVNNLTLLGSKQNSEMPVEERQRSKLDTSLPFEDIDSDIPF